MIHLEMKDQNKKMQSQIYIHLQRVFITMDNLICKVRTEEDEQKNKSKAGFSNGPTQSMQKSTNQVEESPTRREDTNILFVRKKVCQKLARLIQNSYNMEKDKSQELTLLIEGKIHSFYPSSLNEYKASIKGLCRLMKVCLL